MITGTKGYLNDIARDFYCPEHPDNELTVAWHPDQFNVLRCGGNHYPDEVTRRPSLTELYKQGEDLPEPIATNVKKGLAKRAAAGDRSPTLSIRSLVPQRDLGNDSQLSPDQILFLIDYAYKYGLDPYRQHVMMMHGKPYIGIDGYLYHANQTKIPYSMTGRILTHEELKQRGYTEDDMGYLSVITRHDTGGVSEGLGIITKDEMTEMAKGKPGVKRYPVIAAKPGPMMVKRADWQALRRAFPIGETDNIEED